MPAIQISLHGSITTIRVETLEEANTLYDQAKKAMNDYREFSNDETKIVEITTKLGDRNAFRLATMVAVSVVVDDQPDWLIDHFAINEVTGARVRQRANNLLLGTNS